MHQCGSQLHTHIQLIHSHTNMNRKKYIASVKNSKISLKTTYKYRNLYGKFNLSITLIIFNNIFYKIINSYKQKSNLVSIAI